MLSFIKKVFQPFIFGDIINLRELKNVFFMEKLFSKIYSHFPISAIFVEFGVIMIFAKNKFFGMLFHLWD